MLTRIVLWIINSDINPFIYHLYMSFTSFIIPKNMRCSCRHVPTCVLGNDARTDDASVLYLWHWYHPYKMKANSSHVYINWEYKTVFNHRIGVKIDGYWKVFAHNYIDETLYCGLVGQEIKFVLLTNILDSGDCMQCDFTITSIYIVYCNYIPAVLKFGKNLARIKHALTEH